MATLAELEQALVAADKAGDMDAARKLASAVVKARGESANRIPGAQVPGTTAQPAEPGMLDKALGAGEAALSTITGLTGGTLGMLAGGGAQMAADVAGMARDPAGYQPEQSVEQAAMQGAQALTYAPRTASGQQQTQAIGEVMQQMIPVMPLTGELAALSRATQPLATAAAVGARAAPGAIADATQGARQTVMRAVAPGEAPAAPTPGTLGSAGAAATDMALQRRQAAADLPVPIKLTKGQAERDPAQLTFEQETAKDPNLGARLRENAAEQNARIPQNFEAFIDQTGAQAPNLIETGRAVDQALVKDAARAKAEYKVRYRQAEKAGEMEEPVSTAPLVSFIAENASFDSPTLAPSLALARKELVRLGGADLVDGQLQPRDMSLKQMELLRRQINTSIGADLTNATNMKFGVQLKQLIDTQTEGMGGQLYKDARKARQRYAQLYEDNAVVSDLLATRKGTSDRQVALENVFRRTILNGTREDLGKLRRTLQVSGSAEGAQAWRELQGATLRHLIDQATSGAGTDMRGNPIVSAAKLNAAVRALEAGGKLDFVLGKRGAQQIRDINDLAKVIYTLPPGSSVNTSNTAGVLMRAMAEAGAWGGATGLPVPVLTGLKQLSVYAKDRKIAQRVSQALAEAERRDKKPSTKTP